MSKIITLTELFAIRSCTEPAECDSLLADAKIVLVTGVFDVLHQEHIKLLQKAKKLGSLLLVGLESDIRVKELKGKDRPINSLDSRLKALAKLNLADYIFKLPQNLNSKIGREKFIKQLKPQILAVSSSTPNLKEKKRLLKLVNGQVKVVLKYNPQISTSSILASKQTLG